MSVETWNVPNDPLETAILIPRQQQQQPDSSQKKLCHHCVSLRQIVSHIQQQQQQQALCCPICHTPISKITQHNAVLHFKYAKLSYSLALPPKNNTTATKTACHKKGYWERAAAVLVQGVSWILTRGRNDNDNNNNTPPTAVDRIADVLHLDVNQMKILRKGKLLYPTKTTMSPQQVSETLLLSSSSSSSGPWLVLGTPTHETLQTTAKGTNERWVSLLFFLSSKQQQQYGATLHWVVVVLWQFGWKVTTTTLQVTLSLVQYTVRGLQSTLFPKRD